MRVWYVVVEGNVKYDATGWLATVYKRGGMWPLRAGQVHGGCPDHRLHGWLQIDGTNMIINAPCLCVVNLTGFSRKECSVISRTSRLKGLDSEFLFRE